MENDTAKSGSTNDVAEAFQALLANEELMKGIRSLLTQSAQATAQVDTDSAEAPAPATTEKEEQATETAQQGELLPPVADLQALLNNPTVAEKLPQLLTMLAPMMRHGKEEHSTQEVEAESKKLNSASRESLLRALKPFLSPGRQTAVESIMRLSQLSQILQQLK